MNIIEIIPKGRKHAITRENLSIVTGLNDRELRNAIAKSGEVVINNGYGYFIPTKWDRDEVKKYEMSIRSRIKEETKRRKELLKWLKERE